MWEHLCSLYSLVLNGFPADTVISMVWNMHKLMSLKRAFPKES